MDSKKFYFPCQQLVVALDARALKVLIYICNWQSQGGLKYYPNGLAKAMKMDVDECELCIQTLDDAKLIDISRVDQTFMISANGEQMQKYFKLPIKDVIDGKGIPMAKEVTWNVVEEPKEDVSEMTEQQITAMILRLQAQLNEKKEVRKMIRNNEPTDDLPF